ncbi:DNA polymerase I [Curtanaerobium respiraculi]|uniref:DNA polymerase I n=1 Tax=Curtanaerobium respiraculi TaxID=2949669 RepID=UPI0024B3B822|nr:DNA polymerase I [Curtanaerobium respiraculi]
MSRKIAVIDGNSLMHRAYHAIPPTMTAPDGTPTNAVFGFLSMLLKFVELERPDAIVCAFDVGKPKFRIEAMAQYKAQRPPMDEDLRVQFPAMDVILEAMNIPVVKVPGWEGDDILGTIAARDDAAGYETLLVTGDKDACQLASARTRIVNTKKGISDVVIYDPAGVEEKYGVTPAQIPDFLGLMGDSADNIPGVPGIGPKSAAKLLQQFGTMEGLYENLDKLKGKQLEHLRDNKEAAFLSRDIATIVRNLDFPLDIDGIGFPDFDPETVKEAFGELGLRSHLKRLLALTGGNGAEGASVDLAWEGYAVGAEAAAFADSALDAADREHIVGVAYRLPSQESLFGSTLSVAISSSKGAALLRGQDAEDALRRALTAEMPGAIAVFDAKDALQQLYPADSSIAPGITEDELYAARPIDVTLAAYVLNSTTFKHDARALAELYLDAELPAAKSDDDAVVVEAAALRAIARPLMDALEADGSLPVYEGIDLPLVPVLAQMERVGASIDADALAALSDESEAQIKELASRIFEEAGEEFNIDSPKQVGHILFEVIGLKPRKKTSRGYSTDAKVLTQLAEEHPLPALILRYREQAKMKGTYLDALPRLRRLDDRLHTSFNETVTATGRLSSSNPNLQNIPVRTDFGRNVRRCFVPNRDGDVFMSADYSQIELRLLAHLSGDEHLIRAFNEGEDFHAETAARVFGVPVGEVAPEMRSRAKAVNFGIVYGQQAYGLSQSLRIPFAEAQAMIDRYFEAYPGVRTYLDKLVAAAHERGYAETMFGRKRHIPELAAHNAQQRNFGERTAMNHPMQGSAADIIKMAMARASAHLRARFPEVDLMLQVHDELDLSVPRAQAADVAALLKSDMENVVELAVPLVVDVSYGSNWSEAH